MATKGFNRSSSPSLLVRSEKLVFLQNARRTLNGQGEILSFIHLSSLLSTHKISHSIPFGSNFYSLLFYIIDLNPIGWFETVYTVKSSISNCQRKHLLSIAAQHNLIMGYSLNQTIKYHVSTKTFPCTRIIRTEKKLL